MPIPTSRTELLDAIEGNFAKLFKDLETVPEAQCRERTLEGHAKGTMMNVHNLVSYLIGWNRLVLKWIDLYTKGAAIDFPETGFKWNELGLLAQKFYSDYEDLPFDQLLKDFKDAKQRILAFISDQTDDRLYGASWYEKYTLGRMIQLNTSSPYANARTRLRKWKRANNIK